ncbi:MAG: hypothetical protein CL600_10720 [Alteromonas sp.]|nr:hypothetical protein [Alteromonas sp.]|tara:strand:- start:213 stop:443 length:231 start_codon:yes stop_codon:yes gene_type:complete
MPSEASIAYEHNCNDCFFSSTAGFKFVCHNNKRPKHYVIARLGRSRAAFVNPTNPGCLHWEQGKVCTTIMKSPFTE